MKIEADYFLPFWLELINEEGVHTEGLCGCAVVEYILETSRSGKAETRVLHIWYSYRQKRKQEIKSCLAMLLFLADVGKFVTPSISTSY